MSSPTDTALEAEVARLQRKYSPWMYASDIAIEERVSERTAQRHMVAGNYGPIDRLPGGSVRLLTAHYIGHLRDRAAQVAVRATA